MMQKQRKDTEWCHKPWGRDQKSGAGGRKSPPRPWVSGPVRDGATGIVTGTHANGLAMVRPSLL